MGCGEGSKVSDSWLVVQVMVGMCVCVCVCTTHRDGHACEDLLCLVGAQLEGLCDGCRVDALEQQVAALVQQRACNDNDASGAVASHDVLRARELDKHLGGGVQHLHVSEDGGSIISNDHLSLLLLDHLVHATGAQAGADGISDSWQGAVGRRMVMMMMSTSKGKHNQAHLPP